MATNKTLMRFTGVGGQGVLLAGAIFAAAKIKDGGYGLKTATYTSQVRGGPTVVDITLQDDEILYPYANDGEIDFMLSVAQISYNQFKSGVKEGGVIVVEPNLVTPTEEDRKKCFITITEGKYHQVKRMFGAVNNKVLYLKRVQMGNLKLDESIPLGEYRELTTEELELLKSVN